MVSCRWGSGWNSCQCQLSVASGERGALEVVQWEDLLEKVTQLIVAQRLGYLDAKETDELLTVTNEVGKLSNGLIRSLKQNPSS